MSILLSSCSSSIRFSLGGETAASGGKVSPTGVVFFGKASFYHDKFHGRQTASGEIFNQNSMTAAHKTLSFGSKVKITNLKNGRTVLVVINDRGPFVEGRVIDLSRAAAEKLDMIGDGVVDVKCEIVE